MARPHSPNVAEKVSQSRVKENFKGHNVALTLENEYEFSRKNAQIRNFF